MVMRADKLPDEHYDTIQYDVKPLHVRVAEALGWVVYDQGGLMLPAGRGTLGHAPGAAIVGHPVQIPWFDTDWSATGPLIEKYGIMITPGVPGFSSWEAYVKVDVRSDGTDGGTPLEAVCNLILALAEAGKLELEKGAEV
jgi:hypothetical protein